MIDRLLQIFKGGSKQSLRHASLLLAATALLSNVLGLGRNFLFYRFLQPGQLDVYSSSFRVADLILTILVVGAVSSAFIPLASELIAHKKQAEAEQLMNQLLGVATLFFAVLILVLWIAMPYLIPLIVPRFSEAKQVMTADLSRVLLLQTMFFAWSFIMSGLLNSMRRFTAYALAPLIYNTTIIIGAFLARRYGIHALSWSVVVGAAFHASLQYIELRGMGISIRPQFSFSPHVLEVLRLMVPRSISQGSGQLVLTAYTNLGSGLREGSLGVFNGMNDLQTTPTVIVGNSLATAFLPTLSRYLHQERFDEVNVLFAKIIRVSLFTLIPIVILAYVLRAQLVRLYIGPGSFDWGLTLLAIDTLVLFLIGVIPASLVAILVRTFYALKDTRTPMIVTISSSAIAILVAVIGINKLHMNVAGLALAESILMASQALLYSIVLHRRAHLNLPITVLMRSLITYTVGGILAGLTAWGTLQWVDIIYMGTDFISTRIIIGLFIQMVAAGTVGVLVYAGYSYLICRDEVKWIVGSLFSRNAQ